MYKSLLTVIASSLIGACVATVGPAAPPPPGPPPPVVEHRHERVIEGTVFDAETHQPIGRAAVDVTSPSLGGEMTVNTGPDGRFRTAEVPRGEIGIRCRRDGYLPDERHATIDGVVHMDFALRRR